MQSASIAFRATTEDRLDNVLARHIENLSRRAAKRLLEESRVLVEGRIVRVASRTLRSGDRVSVVGEDVELPVISKTADWIAINKPSGIPTQPTRVHDVPSVLERIAVHLARAGEPHEVFVVHRLDQGTSGVLLAARKRTAAASLSAPFSERSVRKVYLALVSGMLEKTIQVDDPIARTGESTFATDRDGREAVTLVEPLASGGGVTLIRVTISTGRTHQIRVHLSAKGLPVAGDRKYGGSSSAGSQRLMLHAWELEHPVAGRLSAPPPADFIDAALRFGLPPGVFDTIRGR